MPGPALFAAAIVTTLVVTTADETIHLPAEAEKMCREEGCVIMSNEQIERVYREGFAAGMNRVRSRTLTSCLKDET